MGDVNCVYCQTVDKAGCLYDLHDNEYQPQKQATSLEIRVPQYEKSVLFNYIIDYKSPQRKEQ